MFCHHIRDMGRILRIAVIYRENIIDNGFVFLHVIWIILNFSRKCKFPAHAMRGPGWIQFFGNRFAFSVKRKICSGLIRPGAPAYNRRMIPVTQNQFFQIILKFCLPLLISDMLPSWRLLHHQKPDFITTVQKGRILGIMRTSHCIDAVCLYQVCILHLQFIGHSTSNPGPLFMTVDSDYFHLFSIQIKLSVIRSCLKLKKTHSKSGTICIKLCASILNPGNCRVKVRIIHVPQMRIRNGIGSHFHICLLTCRNLGLFRCGYNCISLLIEHGGLNGISFPLTGTVENIHTVFYHSAGFGQIGRCDKYPLYMNWICNRHIDIPDNAAKQTVIYIAAFWRNLCLFLGIDPDCQYIFSAVCVYLICNVNRKTGIRSFMASNLNTVQIYFRIGGNPLKVHGNMPSCIFCRQRKVSAVPGHKTVGGNLVWKIFSLMCL